MKRGNEPSDGKGRILQNNEKSGGGRGNSREISEEPSGGNGADYAQDARYRGDGDGASICEKDKRLIAFFSVLSAVLAIQIRGLRL